MKKKLISIVIPVYNQAEKIGKCLDSILEQSIDDYEVIVVNDGSKDNLQLRITNYESQFKRFKYIEQVNQGSNPARNRGVQEVSGEFVIFCDADIVMESQMLEKMRGVLNQKQDISWVYSSFYWGSKRFKLFDYDSDKLKKMPYIHTTSMIRYKDFPGFDSRIKKFQDWDVWLTMMNKSKKGYFLDEFLFRVGTGGTMSSWLPSFCYKWCSFLPQVKKYNKARDIILEKHGLS